MTRDDRSTAEALGGLFDMFGDDFLGGKKATAPSPLQAPVSMRDQMDARHGKFKSRMGLMSHILAGGDQSDFGDEDLRSQHKLDTAAYNMQQMMPRVQEQIGLMQNDDLTDNAAAIFQLSQMGVDDKTMSRMFPQLYAEDASELPDATRAVIHYQDSLNRVFDGETGSTRQLKPGEDGYVKYADAFDQYKNREVGALFNQSMAKSGGAAQGTADVNTKEKEKSQESDMQVGYDLVTEILSDPEKNFHNVYGVLDSMTPTMRQGSKDTEAKLEQIGNILYMFARGDLKGQGQVTEQEAEAARLSKSIVGNYGISEQEAEAELFRLQKLFGDKLSAPGAAPQGGGAPSFETFTADANARGITDPILIKQKFEERFGG